MPKDKRPKRPRKRGPKPERLKLDIDPLAGLARLVQPERTPKKAPPPKPSK